MSHIPPAFRPSSGAARDPCRSFVHRAGAGLEVSGSPIVETLTTDKPVYKVGQPIKITLTETNTTNANVVSANSEAGWRLHRQP